MILGSDNVIVLSMQDMNNRSIRQAMVHTPFILQIELNDDVLIETEVKYISGMDNFKHSPAMRHSLVSANNGKSVRKIIYRFVLQSEKKGTFTIGPCFFKDKTGKFIKSNRLIINVAHEVVLSDKTEVPKYMIQTQFDKKVVKVGEKATLHVQFLDRIFVDDPAIVLPEFENIQLLDVKKNETTTLQHIKGYDYAVKQWTIDFYPKKHGLLIIDGIKIKFLDQKLEETSRSKGVFRRFGSMMKVERSVVMSPMRLEVLALPKHPDGQDIITVGQFSKLELSVNKKSIEQGQGLILTTEICGDGNFEMMHTISLKLPKYFQFYDAGTSIIDKDRKFIHSEFIVQAQEPGMYYIEPQNIHYFDPVENIYKTLESNSIDITITPNLDIQKIQPQEVDFCTLKKSDDKNSIEYYTILDQYYWPHAFTSIIPFIWYQVILYFLLFILFVMMIYRYGIQRYVFTHDTWQRFMMFLQAKKACKYAAYKQDAIAFHSIFIDLFIKLKVARVGIINEDFIEHYLQNNNFTDDQIVQWKNFYSNLLQASFAQKDQLHVIDLYKESLMWLQLLKEKT